jgi:hypothetical protein
MKIGETKTSGEYLCDRAHNDSFCNDPLFLIACQAFKRKMSPSLSLLRCSLIVKMLPREMIVKMKVQRCRCKLFLTTVKTTKLFRQA